MAEKQTQHEAQNKIGFKAGIWENGKSINPEINHCSFRLVHEIKLKSFDSKSFFSSHNTPNTLM